MVRRSRSVSKHKIRMQSMGFCSDDFQLLVENVHSSLGSLSHFYMIESTWARNSITDALILWIYE